MIEQAFVDMPDLLDIEGTEAETARFGLTAEANLEQLQRFEQMQDGAVIDLQRIRRRIAPQLCPSRAPPGRESDPGSNRLPP